MERSREDIFLKELTKKLKAARRAYEKAQVAEMELLNMLYDAGINDMDKIDTAAENADNLEEAITCFLSYGEYNVSGIVSEVKDALAKTMIPDEDTYN